MAASHAVNDKVQEVAPWHILSRMLLPALDKVVIKAGRCDAKIRAAQAALAVERYRLANDKLPTQLSDLVPGFLPAVPSDPFDGKPLRYKTLAKGYVVYSVGDDREDNGGAEKDSKGVSYVPGTDITFTVER
jgi:type II secretory pathway pseudopilin PulG